MKTTERLGIYRTSIQKNLNDIFDKLEEDPEAADRPMVRDTLEQLMIKLQKFSNSLD